MSWPTPTWRGDSVSPRTSIDLWALGGVARLDQRAEDGQGGGLDRRRRTARQHRHRPRRATARRSSVLRLDAPDTVVTVLGWLGIVNGALGVFNLLPGAPLDGGRIVRAVRWGRHGNRHRAMREAGHAGRVIGWAIAGFGLALMLNDRPGLSLLVTGVFIALNAKAEIAFADVSERLGGITVGELTWFGIAETGTDMDADSMIDQRSRLGGAGAVAVRGDDGQLDGLVLEDQLWAVPVEQRPWVMLTSLMAPFSRLARPTPTTSWRRCCRA